ncbi:MAG: DUF3127 domain-containing protein [Bacteroidia bacterium]
MELTAKLIQVLPLQSGEGKNGPWKKQEIIVETPGQYPKKLCIAIWGDKINESILKVGNELKLFFDIESREYNGRWYTEAKAWKIELASKGEQPSTLPSYEESYNAPLPPVNDNDDLPF